jgi:methylenetetrahydrofolate dehydrogenase (NADP+)/methenyltetrahydrofolate cyclohydrolase
MSTNTDPRPPGAQIIDGVVQASLLRAEVRVAVADYAARHGHTPGLAVVLVGDDPASGVYVRTKLRQAAEVGIRSIEHVLPATTTQAALLGLLDQLNAQPDVHGILVQLPLPRHIAADAVLERVRPDKDVDGFHPQNAGRLAIGRPALVPCTPAGSMRLIRSVRAELRGLHAVVLGRSTIVGRPMAQLLLMADCTVTVAHSGTNDLPGLARSADILVAAIGRPEYVAGDWIKPGAIVIDVGINRVVAADGGKPRLVGDVDTAAAMAVAGAITPVPGGVGPMTVATLLANTLVCAELQAAGTA